jgi:hypothetical protein
MFNLIARRTNRNRAGVTIWWFERVRASVAKEAIRCDGHLL